MSESKLSTGQSLSPRAKDLIVRYLSEGRSVTSVKNVLKVQHGIVISKTTIYNYQKNPTGKRRLGRPKKILPVHLEIIDQWLMEAPEMTAEAIKLKLCEMFNVNVTARYICKLKKNIGWTTSRVKYCQLISVKNKKARLTWCLDALSRYEKFENVIFTDETSIEISANGRICSYKKKSEFERLPAKAGKPKHAFKIHMWAGISYHGRTDCCLFTGVMDSVIYQNILQKNLIPWARDKYPNGFRLYQDNDSKHVSKSTKKWMEDVGILDGVMQTPASSPDINPIENVWSTLKDHLQRFVKPRNKEQLKQGIVNWWSTLTVDKCTRYIDHIHRVIPHVILNSGGPTEF